MSGLDARPHPGPLPQERENAADAPGSLNATPLLCRAAVRRFLLDAARRHRPFNKFSRVSEETLVAINAEVRAICVSRVKRLPSKGVTI